MKPGLGRLLVRITVGTIFVEHGTQKLFGWFGGPGPTAAGEHFESLGLRPGRANAILAGSTEVAGGLLLGAGLVTPAAAAGLAGVMISALRTTSWATGIRLGHRARPEIAHSPGTPARPSCTTYSPTVPSIISRITSA